MAGKHIAMLISTDNGKKELHVSPIEKNNSLNHKSVVANTFHTGNDLQRML